MAEGRADAIIIAGLPMGYEDIAPIPPMITEAGGRVCDLDGNDVLTGNGTVLASNGAVRPGLPVPDPGPRLAAGRGQRVRPRTAPYRHGGLMPR